MSRKIRIGLMTAAGGLILTGILLTGAFFFLQSEQAVNRLVPYITEALYSRTGVRVEIGHLSLNLFGRVKAESVRFDLSRDQLLITGETESAEVHFSFWDLLKPRLVLSSIRIQKPRIQLRGLVEGREEEKAPAPNSDGNPLENLLRLPPLALLIHDLSIREMILDADLTFREKFGENALRLLTGPFSVHSRAELRPGFLRLNLMGDFEADNNLIQLKMQTAGEESMNFSGTFAFSGGGSLGVERSDEHSWKFFVQQFRSEASVFDARLEKHSRGHYLLLKVPAFVQKIRLQGESLQPGTTGNFLRDLFFPLGFHGYIKIHATDLHIVDTKGNSTKTLTCSPEVRLRIQGKLTDVSDFPSGLSADLFFRGNTGSFYFQDDSSQRLSLAEASLTLEGQWEKGTLESRSLSHFSELRHPLISRPLSARISASFTGVPLTGPASGNLQASVDGSDILDLFWQQRQSSDATVSLSGNSDIRLASSLSGLNPALTELLSQLGGGLSITSEFQASLPGPLKESSEITAKFSHRLRLPFKKDNTRLFSFEDLHVKNSLTYQPEQLLLDTRLVGKGIQVVEKALIKEHQATVFLLAKPGNAPKNFEIRLDAGAKELLFPAGSIPGRLGENLGLSAHLTVRDMNTLSLDSLKLVAGPEANLQVQAQVQASPHDGYGLGKGVFSLGEFQSDEFTMSGRSFLSWEASMANKNTFTLAPEIRFEQASFKLGDFELLEADGGIKIFETFLLEKDSTIKPLHLVDTDPFRRVDIKRMDPFLDRQHRLTVRKLRWGNFEAGPLKISASVEQNTLNIPVLDLELFGGHFSGECYVDFHPKRMLVRLKAMLTGVDPGLTGPLHKASGKREPIDANLNLQADLNHQVVDGEVNITRIGKSQLLSLIAVLDPDFKDEQIAKIRNVLKFLAPEFVNIRLYQGFMDLSVRLQGVAEKVEVREFPVSVFLSRFGEDFRTMMSKIPLS